MIKWEISKELLSDTLLNPNDKNKKGLLMEKVECAGKIIFENVNCKIIDSKKICDKNYKTHTVIMGDKYSVNTPLSDVNFHTHPLQCYKDNMVIWGWPSGEDMRQCIYFAQQNNIFHVIFTIEGTFIILVNKKKISMSISTIKCIEDFFKMTHEFRSFDSNINSFKLFMKQCNIKPIKTNNALLLWLHLVNNFTLKCCGIKDDTKIFKVKFIPNKTFQCPINKEKTMNTILNIKTTDDLIKNLSLPSKIEFKL